VIVGVWYHQLASPAVLSVCGRHGDSEDVPSTPCTGSRISPTNHGGHHRPLVVNAVITRKSMQSYQHTDPCQPGLTLTLTF